MMKWSSILLVFVACLCGQILTAQKATTHTVIKDHPGFGDLCNLYVNPMFYMDFPMYGPRLAEPLHFEGSSVIGYGLRSQAVIKGQYIADLHYRRGIWPARTRQIEFGGTYIFRSVTKVKPMIVNITRRESGNYVYTENLHTQGNQLNFAGLRAGLLHYRAAFEDDNFNGFSDSYGLYAGLAFGFTRNLQVRLKDNRVREYATFARYYIDFMFAGSRYFPVNPLLPRASGIPLGFRFGYDVNSPLSGAFATVSHVELGYRPGLSGYYVSMAITPVSIRTKIKAFDP